LKKVLTIIAFIYSVQIALAQITSIDPQQRIIDSLKQELQATTNDTLRLVLANELHYIYLLKRINYDSAIVYSKQSFALAHELGYKIDEAYALDMIGDILNLQHNEHTLETFFKGVKIAEDPQIESKILPIRYLNMMIYWHPMFTDLIKSKNWSPRYFRLAILGSLYQDLGHAYGKVMPNQQRLSFYTSKAIELYKSQKDTFLWAVTYENIAEYFYSSNQLDSSPYYAQKADTLRIIYNKLNAKYLTNPLLGAIYFKKGNDSLALHFIRQFIKEFKSEHEGHLEYWLPYFTLAEYFFKTGMMDSSLYYATEAYKLATNINFQENLQETSALLAKLYKKTGVSDSAMKYYEIALALSDSINDASKKTQLQRQDFEQQREREELEQEKARERLYILFVGLAILLTIALFLLWNNRQRKKANKILQQKNIEIGHALQELKSTQAQLIQSEKMASLGELTAGIAHEIQNPLNFVNNFSEINTELIDELKNELLADNKEEALLLADDIKDNEQKIIHHGKRADSIVKGMLQHSRASTGKKELTDINALIDESLRLSYHGMRAKNKEFNAEMKSEFDESIGKIDIVPQDISRVLLNLFNNAFYAVSEAPVLKGDREYKPTVSVCTKRLDGKVEIHVRDNGNGIPQNIIDKIFQPFFTTKPTGQGTGLGLSLSYDIVKAHGGELKVESKDGDGSEFIIELPLNTTG
jgi:two-component system NtrC family sensor kinase